MQSTTIAVDPAKNVFEIAISTGHRASGIALQFDPILAHR